METNELTSFEYMGREFIVIDFSNIPPVESPEPSEPTEVQFEEQEILLEEMNSKLIDGAVKGGIPRTFFQRHGYPSTKTQMTDLDKEMLNKA